MTSQRVAAVLNLLIRLWMVWFMIELLLNPGDPRFAGKISPVRNVLIVFGFAMLFPLLHRTWDKKPWDRYPWWSDTFYLSAFWVDMAFNSFGLYQYHKYWDLFAHSYGPGALCLAFHWAFHLRPLEALGVVMTSHIVLEGMEFYGDVYGGMHNVQNVADTTNDMLAGVIGGLTALVLDGLVGRLWDYMSPASLDGYKQHTHHRGSPQHA